MTAMDSALTSGHAIIKKTLRTAGHGRRVLTPTTWYDKEDASPQLTPDMGLAEHGSAPRAVADATLARLRS